MRRKSSFAVLWIMVVIALIGCSAAPAPKPEAPKAAEPAKAVEAPKPAVAPKATEPSKPAATPAAAKEAAKPKAEAAKPKAQPVTVRVSSMAGSITDFPTTEAAKKFGDKYSVIMDVVAAQRPNDQIAALVGGSLDIVFVAPDVVVRAVAGGGKIKIIGARQDAPAWSLVSSKNITKPDQLKGKVVGASELKGSTTVMLRKLLEKLGLKSNDYDLVVVGGSSARYAAITSGAVSAGLLNQPFDLKAVAEGYNRLGVTSEAVPKWLSDSIVTSDSFISKNPEALVRYLRAYQEGVDWLLDPGKKNEVLAVLQPALKASATEAAEMYRMYYETPGVIPKQAKVNMDNLQAVIDVMVAEGDLEKDKIPAIKDLVDTRFLEQAIERK